jgi:ATP-dependent protease ClpP protease subunit
MKRPGNLSALRAAWRVTADVERRTSPCFRLENSSTPTFYVYEMIGAADTDAADFVQAVGAVKGKVIDLHLNSPGGFVYDGVSMYEALLNHPAQVNVHIDGMAASAASFLAQAGDTITMARAGRMMIHDAQGIGIGSPADIREYADILDEVSNDIAGIYARRAGGSPASWRKAMTATTWYSSDQAVSAKLADRISGSSGPDNRTRVIQARHRAALNALEGVK